MNYYSVFYWLSVADGVKRTFDIFSNWFLFFTIIFAIVWIVIHIIALDPNTIEHEGEKGKENFRSFKHWQKWLGRTFWVSFIMCFITWIGYVATPTKKDCLLIVAGGAVGNFLTTDTSAKALPADVTRFLHLSLNKEIEELSQEMKTSTADVKKELGVKTQKDELIDKLKTLSKDEIIKYLQTDSIKTK